MAQAVVGERRVRGLWSLAAYWVAAATDALAVRGYQVAPKRSYQWIPARRRGGQRVALRPVRVAYYRCRTRSGPAGRCHSTVLGFTCHEQRNSIPTEIDARATCRRGHATVIHTYQQDT